MAEEIRIFELKMELDLLASKIKECITEFFPLHANIKGNIYIVADDVEISLPLSEQLQLPSKPLPYKELGGYYDQVKDQLPNFNSPKRYTNFNQFFTESCCMDPDIRESTRKNYSRTLQTLKEYAPNATFADIDQSYIYGYEVYLSSMKLKANSIIKHLKQLKKALHHACKLGYLKNSVESLFRECRVKPERTFKESLTPKELVFLQKYLQDNFSTMADREKEILSGFLFSCLTGLRYSDICRVEYSHIKRIKNKRWIILTMKKTAHKVFVPIEQMFSGRALKVMRLFRRTRGKLFYLPSNAICNRVLKRIFSTIFRNRKNISFHTGRHTAATLLLYYNTPLTTIKGILGHTNIKTTETYATINEATLYHSIAKIRFSELDREEKRLLRTAVQSNIDTF